MTADRHQTPGDADLRLALRLLAERGEFREQFVRMARDLVAMPKGRNAHLAELLHLLAAHAHEIVQIFLLHRVLLLVLSQYFLS